MGVLGSTVSDNIARVYDRIAAAAEHTGRSPGEVTLVAVTKKQSATQIAEALAAGISEIGENYVQEAVAKQEELGRSVARWHLLGHLQGNKARLAAETFDVIQSVDSVSLARQLARRAEAAKLALPILLQVHLGTEETKYGLPPDQVADAAVEVAALPGLALQGLMGIAPQDEDARPHFRVLRRLFDALPTAQRATLSMGMTADFETAIEEGATLVRIGTAIFGARPA